MAAADPSMFVTWVDEIRERAQTQAKAEAWTNTHELLAVVAQWVSILNRNFVAANTKKGAQLPKVWEPVRPGDERKRGVSLRELVSRMVGR